VKTKKSSLTEPDMVLQEKICVLRAIFKILAVINIAFTGYICFMILMVLSSYHKNNPLSALIQLSLYFSYL